MAEYPPHLGHLHCIDASAPLYINHITDLLVRLPASPLWCIPQKGGLGLAGYGTTGYGPVGLCARKTQYWKREFSIGVKINLTTQWLDCSDLQVVRQDPGKAPLVPTTGLVEGDYVVLTLKTTQISERYKINNQLNKITFSTAWDIMWQLSCSSWDHHILTWWASYHHMRITLRSHSPRL